MPRDLDLDVDSPEKVATVLRGAADAYHEAATELEAAWGYGKSGHPWTKIARALETAATQIERIIHERA